MQLYLVFSELTNRIKEKLHSYQLLPSTEWLWLGNLEHTNYSFTAGTLHLFQQTTKYIQSLFSYPFKFSVDWNPLQSKTMLITYLITICLALSWIRSMLLCCSWESFCILVEFGHPALPVSQLSCWTNVVCFSPHLLGFSQYLFNLLRPCGQEILKLFQIFSVGSCNRANNSFSETVSK